MRIAKPFAAVYIHRFGSAKLTGGAPGLQIRCEGVKAFSGGFDSHALPPIQAIPASFSGAFFSFIVA